MDILDIFHQQKNDRVFLLSGGPKSHLATKSMLAKSFSHRILITQPDITPAKKHSPLQGDSKLDQITEPIIAQLQSLENGWKNVKKIQATNIAELFRSLRPHTPNGLKWSGALSYDLLQWTQPIRLQNPPKRGSIIGLLWLVEEWINGEKIEIKEIEGPILIKGEKSSHTDKEHINEIHRIQKSIRAGELYQVNFGRKWSGPLAEHPSHIFHRLAITNPAPFSAYIEAKDLGIAIASSSPEILLNVDSTTVLTAPIKGTNPRGSDEFQEIMLRQDLLNDQKERAEHRMLVDLERNDLSIVCKPGSVNQIRFDVEAYSNVQHLVSHISGELCQDKDGLDAFQALFPGGSITGCPKTVVCASIDELEGEPRSFWTGSAGWVDVHSGECTWNILIRTLEARQNDKKWFGSVTAGGGITIESQPEAEVAEAIWKASALRKACGWIDQKKGALISKELRIHPQKLEHRFPPATKTGSINHGLAEKNDVVFIDNLDSFSYNIIHLIAAKGRNVNIVNGREENIESIDLVFDSNHIIIGPGPGRPEINPFSMAVASRALKEKKVNVLGICLGHQALGVADGMELIECPSGPVHGIPVEIIHDKKGLFKGIGSCVMTRYNSLILNGASKTLNVNATDISGLQIMGLTNNNNIHGIQFHPESIGSIKGISLLNNFLTKKRIIE